MSGEFGVSPLSLPDGVQVLCASDHLRTGLQSLLHHTGKGCEPRLTFRGSEEWAELSRAMMCGSMVAYSISFAARYSDSRALEIGDRSSIGHDCCFVIGKHISIGKECMIANDRPSEAARKDVVPGLGLQTARPPSPPLLTAGLRRESRPHGPRQHSCFGLAELE